MDPFENLLDLLSGAELPLLEGFSFEKAEAFSLIGALDAAEVVVIELSASHFEAEAGGFTFVMSGGQIAPVGSLEELYDALDTAFSDGSLTQLRVTQADEEIAAFDLTDDGYTFRSGAQALTVVGAWPASLLEIARVARLIEDVQDLSSIEDESRNALTDLLASLDLSQVRLTDGDQVVLEFSIGDDAGSITTGTTSLNFSEERSGPAKLFSLQISGIDPEPIFNSEQRPASLSDIGYTIPEIVEELGLDYTQAELDRLVLLGEHTYISYTLDQSLLGPYDFDLKIMVDHYYSDAIPVVVTGTEFADILIGTSADELLVAGAGSDTINGGGGADAARFAGLSGHFSVEVSDTGLQVRDRRSDAQDVDFLINIEALKFDDRFVELGDLDWVSHISTAQVTELAELYIAYFGRVPDALGVLFWLEALSEGLSIEDVATQFAQQPENTFGAGSDTSDAEFVDTVYENVLGRAPDAAGATFWTDALASGDQTRDTFIFEFLNGSRASATDGSDAAYLAELTEIGTYFALEKGLNQVDEAAALVDLYASGAADRADVIALIDVLHTEAEVSNDTLLISLPNLAPDLF